MADDNTRMLQDLSHELRDALSPAVSALDVLRLKKFEPEAARIASEQIERGLRRAVEAVSAFVLAEQCEAGSVALDVGRHPLDAIVSAALERASPTSAGRLVAAPGSQVEVAVDAVRTAEALAAVVRHALAVSVPRGELQLRSTGNTIVVRTRSEPATVPDEGWFAPFRGRRPGDMALRTARRLIVLQGGRLEVRRDETGEIEFRIDLPCTPAERAAAENGRERRAAAQAETRASAEEERQRPAELILIVDDSAPVRAAYRDALAEFGYRVAEAENAEVALRILEQDLPDVALIDINLTRMNGFDLARAIRAAKGGAVRLIMLSGMTLDATRRGLALEAGFDECLDKMSGPAALHRLLGGASDGGGRASPRAGPR
ncbi:MAG: hybrid sensor histidine kinase/response regulator [Gammaproteobacteria bacterium]|nr:hybrid sensor histidine kinase/response regulator [Gammaproteobacteria bacterium]